MQILSATDDTSDRRFGMQTSCLTGASLALALTLDLAALALPLALTFDALPVSVADPLDLDARSTSVANCAMWFQIATCSLPNGGSTCTLPKGLHLMRTMSIFHLQPSTRTMWP